MVSSSGVIITFAGTGAGTCGRPLDPIGGDGCSASPRRFDNPYPVAFDASGNMYIPDTSHNRVRQVAATAGVVTSASIICNFAGTGSDSYTGDGGPAKSARSLAPSAVAIDPAQNVYIADTQDSAIRKVHVGTLDIETIISSSTINQYYQSPETAALCAASVYTAARPRPSTARATFSSPTAWRWLCRRCRATFRSSTCCLLPYTYAIRVDQ